MNAELGRNFAKVDLKLRVFTRQNAPTTLQVY